MADGNRPPSGFALLPIEARAIAGRSLYTGSMCGWFSLKRNPAVLACLMVTFFITLAGCRSRSPYVQTTLLNEGATTVQNIEVDYPSASFGVSSLEPGRSFMYRFQIQGSGHLQLLYVDSAHRAHSETGPYVAEGQEGTLRIAIGSAGKNMWTMQLMPQVTAPKK